MKKITGELRICFYTKKIFLNTIKKINSEIWLKNKEVHVKPLTKSINDIFVDNKKDIKTISEEIKKYLNRYEFKTINSSWRGIHLKENSQAVRKTKELYTKLLNDGIDVTINEVFNLYICAIIKQTIYFTDEVKEFLKSFKPSGKEIKGEGEREEPKKIKNQEKENQEEKKEPKKMKNQEKEENFTVTIKGVLSKFIINGKAIKLETNKDNFKITLKK